MFTAVPATTLILTVALIAGTAAQSTKLSLQSPAFKNDQPLPPRYTGDGAFKSPPLAWSGLPPTTKELALVVHDADVPLERYSVHWVLYNIPASTKGVPEDLPATPTLARPAPLQGATQGPNALKRIGYLPPKPFAGSGLHRYVFTLYALDADLPLPEGLTKEQLLAALDGHVIAKSVLTAVYERKGS
jgi:Raf kinase inhibitor-like YbhB/YbcL family protein